MNERVKAMPNLYIIAQRIWRTIPIPVKNVVRKKNLLDGFKRLTKRKLGSFDAHNSIYDDSYFEGIETYALQSKDGISKSILDLFEPDSLIDIGCGTGAVIDELGKNGIKVVGFDYSEAALKICREKGLSVTSFDIEAEPQIPDAHFDVALCTEVAEHIPEEHANYLIDMLTTLAPQVVFTAAFPGQADIENHDHVNEQEQPYWIEKFKARRFELQPSLVEEMQAMWISANVSEFYTQNLMIFRKK